MLSQNNDQVYIICYMKQYLRDNSVIQLAATSQAICWAKHVAMSVNDFHFISFHLFVLQSLTLHKNKTLQEVLIKN